MVNFTKRMWLAAAVVLASVLTGGLAARSATEDLPTHLIVYLTNESTQAFAFAEQPQVTFGNTDMTIACGGSTVTLALADVDRWEFADNGTSSIEEIATQSDLLKVSFAGAGTLVLEGDRLSTVTVYDINGRVVAVANATEGAATLELGQKGHGVYIVAPAGYKSFKLSI